MKIKMIALILASIMLLILLVGCSKQTTANANKNEAEKYIPVEVETVEKRNISNLTTFTGKVNPDKDIAVLPKLPGKVMTVGVRVGDKVNKGAVLFTLDPEDVQKQVSQAEAQLKIAEANFLSSKEKIDNAKMNLQRQKQLYEAGAISKSQLEQFELQASDSNLALIEAQVNQAKVGYDQALDSLKSMSVTSPVDGVVASVNVEVGEMVSNAQPALTIADTDKVYVTVSVAENIVNELNKNQSVKVVVPSVSEQVILGKIDNISPISDSRTQLYPVKIYLENKSSAIKPGMFAKIQLETKLKNDVIAIKSEAVVLKNGKTLAYVVQDDKAVEKELKLGLDTGAYIEVLQGLNPAEKLITKGQTYVDNGVKVKVVGGSK